MTGCFLCMVDTSHDVELLLPSITESVAIGLPFPVHSSPLREQSVVLEISLAWAIGNMQCRWQIQIHPLLSPITLSGAMIYWGRKLERPSSKSNNSVAVEKEIRRRACPSKPDSHPSPTQPCLWTVTHSFFSCPPTPSLCCCRLTQVYHQLLPVDGLLPFPPSSVRLAEKASQEEISNPITRGASTSAAGAPQCECWWEQPGLHNNRPGSVC